MTTNKTPCPPPNKAERARFIAIYLGVALMGALLSLLLFVRSDWDKAVVVACVVYTLVATVFLGVQIWGFVASQTFYSDDIEGAKFRLIELEEAEWGTGK